MNVAAACNITDSSLLLRSEKQLKFMEFYPFLTLYLKEIMKVHVYYVYIITNLNKTVLYTGMTNDLYLRLQEHRNNTHIRNRNTFSGRYRCQFLLYYEQFQFVKEAYDREKEIKGWSRAKKEALIKSVNKNWDFLDPEDAAV